MESNVHLIEKQSNKQYTFNNITNCIVSFFPPFKSANDLAYKIEKQFRTSDDFEKSIESQEFAFKLVFTPKTKKWKYLLLMYAHRKGIFESIIDKGRTSNILWYILLRAYLKLNQIEEEYYDNLDIEDFNSFCQIFFNWDKNFYKAIADSSNRVLEIL